MSIFAKQIGKVIDIADMASGGAVVIPAPTVIEQVRVLRVAQTTAAQVVTLPDPSDTSVSMLLPVVNTGSEAFTIYGVTLTAGGAAMLVWNGSAWAADVAPSTTGEAAESLVATGQNVLPDLTALPRPGTLVKFFVNGVFVPSGITANYATGAVTVVPATVGYNIEDADEVTAFYNAV